LGAVQPMKMTKKMKLVRVENSHEKGEEEKEG